ncbi:MAG: LytTR family DNA-binding domain-containing protein [Rubricoccaceae bacterium]
MTPLRALVADDEPLARATVVSFLEAQTDILVVAESTSGAETAHALRHHQPDVVFLDIEMPSGSGFEAIAGQVPPAVVFVTAFAEFAVQAFDLPAVDYLVKPFDRERFDRALDRVRYHLGHASSARLPERLAVRSGDRVVLVPLDRVEAIESAGDYTQLHTPARSFVHDARLYELEDELAPRFIRVHRRWLVAPEHVAAVRRKRSGDAILTLASGRTLRASRGRRRVWASALHGDGIRPFQR